MKSILATALVCIGSGLPAGAQNLIINGGFESPSVPGPLTNGSTAVQGWVSVDNVSDGTADNNYACGSYYGHSAPEGQCFVYIDNNSHPSPSLNGIYQDFATVPGLSYRVTFDAATEISYGTAGLLKSSAGDAIVHYTLPNVNAFPLPNSPPYAFAGWSNYSFRFTAIGPTTRLQFFDEGYQVGGDPTVGNASPLLDNVQVSVAEHAIYKLSESQTAIGNGLSLHLATRGVVVLEPGTVHGTIVAGFVVNRVKSFVVIPMENYRIDHVTGTAGATFTIIAKAESPGTQFAGTLLESVYARGRDITVTIGPAGPMRLPRVFTSSAKKLTRDEDTGATSTSELAGRYTLDTTASLASNEQHESFEAVVARFVNTFTAYGYLQVSLTPSN